MRAITKVSLIGFMGSGKSSVAALLAPTLGFSLVEMDDEIVSRSGLASIPSIFEAKGELFFRDLEAEVARSLSERSGLVISTGGGAVERPENVQHLKAHGGVLVYLRTSFATVVSRLGDISNRPLFKIPEHALTLYNRRVSIYERLADLTLDTDGLHVGEVCSSIVELLGDKT